MTSDGVPLTVRHEADRSRFVAHRDASVIGKVDYLRRGDLLVVVHTETAPEHRGQGVAAELTRALLSYADRASFRIRPVCPYTVTFLQDHPQYDHLLG